MAAVPQQAEHARWLQASPSSDRDRAAKLAARAAPAGYELLMLTTDVPVGANRENNLRNGFTLPVRITPRLLLDGAAHPRWSIEVFARTLMKYGIPHLENTDRGDRPSILAGPDRDMRHRRDSVDGEYVRHMRDQWKGALLVKGTLHPADAEMAVRVGLDGVVVSNHGGRQLQGEVVAVGSRDVSRAPRVPVAGEIRRLQRERFATGNHHGLHPESTNIIVPEVFRKSYVALLKKHRIEYDERYLWD